MKTAKKIFEIAHHLGLNLTEEKAGAIVEKSFKKINTLILEDSKDRPIVLRISLEADFNWKVKREINLYKRAKELGIDYFPTITDQGENEISWYVYNYIDGEPLGNTFQFKKGTDYQPIFDLISQLNQHNQELIKAVGPGIAPDPDLKRYLSWNIERKPELVNDPFIGKVLDSLKANFREVKNGQFSHGDFHALNMFKSSSGMKVIDWETMCLSSAAFDLSFVYTMSFDQQIRREILALLKNNFSISEKEIYTIILLSLIRELFEWHQIADGKNYFLTKDKIINNISWEEIIDNLLQEIRAIYQKLREL